MTVKSSKYMTESAFELARIRESGEPITRVELLGGDDHTPPIYGSAGLRTLWGVR